jgi:hypothetical protein
MEGLSKYSENEAGRMSKQSLEDVTKWITNWEKNFDATIKAVKKFKEDLLTKPTLSDTTAKKYRLYLDLLDTELQEVREIYEEVEPIRNPEPVPYAPLNIGDRQQEETP